MLKLEEVLYCDFCGKRIDESEYHFALSREEDLAVCSLCLSNILHDYAARRVPVPVEDTPGKASVPIMKHHI